MCLRLISTLTEGCMNSHYCEFYSYSRVKTLTIGLYVNPRHSAIAKKPVLNALLITKPVFCFAAKPQPLDLGFILGASGQNASSIFKSEIAFIKYIISSYSISPVTTQVGAILYGRNAQIAFEMNKHSSESSLKAALDQLKNPSDGNNIGEALQLARTSLFSQENGARYGVQKSLVIFLNEKLVGNNNELKTELEALKSSGIRISVIGIGNNVDRKDAAEIASSNALFFPASLEELNAYLYPVYVSTLEGELIFSKYFNQDKQTMKRYIKVTYFKLQKKF